MLDLNQVTLVGRLVEKPREIKLNLPSGDKAAAITIAENATKRDRTGRAIGNFIPITLMGETAVTGLKRLKPGQQVLVTGVLLHNRFKSPKIEKALATVTKLLKDNPEAAEALAALKGLEWRDKTTVGVKQLLAGNAPMSSLGGGTSATEKKDQASLATSEEGAQA